MTEKVRRLRPKGHEVIAEALRVVVQLPLGLSDAARDEVAAALNRYDPDPTWTFTMLSNDQLRLVLKKINASERPAITLRVWTALTTHVLVNTGEIMASRARLAEDAETTPQEVSRALTLLTELGPLIRIRPGRYKINPHVGWAGSLEKREAASRETPPLRLVESPR